MYTDLYDHSRKLLIEANASGTRQHNRAAFGQVLEYARYEEHEYAAVLLPTEPPADMEELLEFYAVGVVWETSKGAFEEYLAVRIELESPALSRTPRQSEGCRRSPRSAAADH